MSGVRWRRTLVAIDSSVSFSTDGVGRPQCAYEMTSRSPEAPGPIDADYWRPAA
jgi:hypothetical protein